MRAPQIIMITIMAMGMGLHLAKNGEPRDGKYSFSLMLVSTAIEVGLLIWGGFFG